jgi:hypothetical protein
LLDPIQAAAALASVRVLRTALRSPSHREVVSSVLAFGAARR